MNRITKEQGIILTGITGKLCCNMSDFHKDAEERLGAPIFTHEFASEELWQKLKILYSDDFLKIVPKDDVVQEKQE